MKINGGGYTFINRKTLAQFKTDDINNLFQTKTDVLLKVRRLDGSNEYTVVKKLGTSNNQALSVQLTGHSGYTTPVNSVLGPYIFLGTETTANSASKTTQGFKSNSKDITFVNCDATPNAYFAFYPNLANGTPSNRNATNTANEQTGVAVDWRKSGLVSPDRMEADYFYLTEMNYGGCGVYTSSDRWSTSESAATGAAIGIR